MPKTRDSFSRSTFITDWFPYIPTFGAGWGTVTVTSFLYRRVGDTVEVQGTFVTGTTSSSSPSISFPASVPSIDSTKMPTGTLSSIVGQLIVPSNTVLTYGANLFVVFYDGTTNSTMKIASAQSGGSLTSLNPVSIASSGNSVNLNFKFPVTGWSADQ